MTEEAVAATYRECFERANDLTLAGDFQKALDLYDLLLAKKDDDPHLLFSVGTLYNTTGRHGLAIPFLQRSISLNPNHPEAWNNLAGCYRSSGNDALAKECYEESIRIKYSAFTLSNYSGFYVNQGMPDEAIRLADEALALAPDNPHAMTHKGIALMERGEWEEGFKWYDGRLRLPGYHRREYGVKRWTGGRVKLLAIHGEQGIGDEIMFMSCFAEVVKRVDSIVIECAERLVPLFERTFGVPCYGTHEALIAKHKPDAFIPMGSMPRITGFVKHQGYLKPEFVAPKTERFRIGLSFRGGTRQTHEHLRNFPLEMWKPLTEFDAEIYSIQHGPAMASAAKLGIIHDQAWIDDLDKLCGLINSCDLVISVCGTAVHMSGAMNVPCFCLVPAKPAWRYGIKGDKMPWYDSVKLFRQGAGEEWPSVVQRVKEAVSAYHARVSRIESKVA